MATGTIKTIVSDKGFGFIQVEGSADVFFHHSEYKSGSFEDLTPGTKVDFTMGSGPKGPKAEAVTLAA